MDGYAGARVFGGPVCLVELLKGVGVSPALPGPIPPLRYTFERWYSWS